MGWSQYLAKFSHSPTTPKSRAVKPFAFSRRLAIESLEPRIVLSAAGLVDVGSQPAGELSGKITYIHGGHGYTTFMGSGSNDFWSFQRGNNNGMVEDLGNQEQMTFLADYLFRAGATVVPMRPVGHQTQEYILDNDDPGVSFSGTWSNSTSSVYFAGTTGSAADAIPYRYASTSLTETAYARYRPNFTTAGFFPVYAWTRPGTDRATDQLYRVNHSGGITEVKINHREVGNGLIYLGTYYFEAGNSGYVDISNRSSSTGNVVIADMIRFGNGMGDIDRGVGISGRAREDEPALYWIKWHVDRSRGISTSEYSTGGDDEDATVAASPKWAEFMNQGTSAGLPNRLLVSFHSNAANGTARGVVALHNTTQGGDTPNQLFLAQTLGNEIEADLVAQNGQFENNWGTRNPNTYEASFNYGELNNAYINNEFDATIVEVGFHDTPADAVLMRDPKFRDAVARATYQGMVKYFNNVDGGATSLTMLPGQAPQVRAEVVGSGSVKLTWTAPAANSYNGDAATSYRVYGSTNGYGFDGGRVVAGGGTLTTTLTGLDPNLPYYFKVAAVNAGGEGAASEVVAALPTVAPQKMLIVNGFDRQDRFMNPTQNYGGTIDRVWPRLSNSYDYSVQVASAIKAHAPTMMVDSASNEMVASGAVNLSNYAGVVWILGEESTADETFSAAEQTKVTNYLAAGGKLFVTGSELAYDLDQPTGPTAADRAFLNNVLKTGYNADDANTYAANPAAGSIFAGLPQITFDNGAQFYNVESPDRLSPTGGSTAALTYATGGAAGLQYADPATGAKVVVFGFPFETITTASLRTQVMGRVLDYFAVTELPDEIEAILDNDSGPGVYSETGTWDTATAAGYNGLTYRFAVVGSASTATWQFYAPFAGHAELSVQHRSGSNRADDAAFSIDTGSGVETASINQKNDSLVWVPLGEYYFQEGVRTITLDAQTSTGGSVVIADVVRVVLFNAPEPTGDFNDDGLTDGTDFLAWQRNVATTEPELADGDGNGDNQVDGDDLALWLTNFGSQTAAAQGASTAAFSASLAAESSRAARSAALLDDMASVAQRVAASAALERFGVGNPIGREFIAAATLTDSRRHAAEVERPHHRRVEVEQPISLVARHEQGGASSADYAAELDDAFGQQVDWSWSGSD